jgi:hypothetical protein
MITICSTLDIDIAIYDEEPYDGLLVPTLDEVLGILDRVDGSASSPQLCIAVSNRVLSYHAARERAGSLADKLRLTSSGYVLFPFLEP